ncbi:MAG: hypothetical protein M3N95_11180 [Actinomycetota bacterium]|nr:hypothetical protein [Actinomycetota bacterium]
MKALVGALLIAGMTALVITPAARATAPGPNGRIAVEVDTPSAQQLITLNPDGTDRVALTQPSPQTRDTAPAWSPDGTKVAFAHDDVNGIGNIDVINADGTRQHALTDCADQSCGNGSPTWTPDGRQIVFEHCCVAGNGGLLDGIYVMNADGSGLHALTINPDINYGDGVPTVSPEGDWVAFTRTKTDPHNATVGISAMFLIRLDGTGLHRITSFQLMVDEKDWSPDGSTIVFTSHAGSNTGPFRADVFTIHPDGTDLTQLTHTTPGQSFAFFPTWSPRGDRILFDFSPSHGCADMFTMRPDGSGVHQVTQTAACESWSSWGRAPLIR